MNVIGRKQPVYLKTYGRQKRKFEQWFSPDLRKKAFSSSTPSSDLSMPEPTPFQKRRKKKSTTLAASRATRVAKKRAMAALKEQDSDEENIFVPDTPPRKTTSAKAMKRSTLARMPPDMDDSAAGKSEQTTGLKMRRRRRRKKQQQQIIFSSSEDESFMMKKKPSVATKPSTVAQGKLKEARVSAGAAPLDRFVTHRRRAPLLQSGTHTTQRRSGVPNSSLNSSGEFVPAGSFGRCAAQRKQPTILKELCPEKHVRKPSVASFGDARTQPCAVLREISLNNGEEHRVSGKLPLLCSTPSLSSARRPCFLEPSVSEISSLSCGDAEGSAARSGSESRGRAERMRRNWRAQKISRHGDGPNEDEEDHEEDQKNGSVGLVSAQKHLDILVEQLKEQCRSVSSVVLLEEMDSLRKLTKGSDGRIQVGQDTDSPRLQTEDSTSFATCHDNQTSDDVSNCANLGPLHLTASPSTSCPPSASPGCVFEALAQALVDRLKVECLSSCLTVSLRPLDPSVLRQQGAGESWTAQVTSPCPPETEGDDRAQRGPLSSADSLELCPLASELPSEQTGGPWRRLSASCLCSAASPEPKPAPAKAPAPAAPRERNGTGRKAGVSGLSILRWAKRSTAEGNTKRRKNESSTWSKSGHSSLNYLLPTTADTHDGEPLYGWMQGTNEIGLPVTPLRVKHLNLSSILANFTPDALSTHSWGRLKAALSVHKKKTAIPTPRRLAMSKLRSPGDMECSLELCSTPLSKLASSHLPRSNLTNTSMRLVRVLRKCNHHYVLFRYPDTLHLPVVQDLWDEDISDAEKVYQECEQDGPISFDDCIPPDRMKCCNKIGEGTFGEVFSTVDASNQIVALKIIPVEGHQKVNGEPQKTFAEILHEIIISKELSSLNSKEKTRTNGFIGLNNLYCVRGCYPSALLKAWDKFDQAKGSENDRPDFFSEEQLFLIFEFEFGGSDLENMNRKLSSMIQAKSVLHQVTAALAVAEQALCFEHRDLHWGNILVKTTKEKKNEFILDGSVHSIDTRGVHVNIIDYSLSRLEIDGLTVSCDIAHDEELFMGQGDYQFEIYRLMKKENNNCWSEYNPHSNVLWLHYLADKLLAMKYKTKTQSSQQKAAKSSLQAFHSEVLSYSSATDALLHCQLFQ